MANVNPFRAAREKAGLGLREAAKLLGSAPSTLVEWEYGRKKPELASLNKLADLYRVSLDELTGRATAPLPSKPATETGGAA